MTELDDESLESIIDFTQKFLDDGNLAELHMSIKNKILKIDATDDQGWTYQLIRKEK